MLVNQAAIGRPISVYVEITLESQSEESLDAFETAVRDCPEVARIRFGFTLRTVKK